MIVKFSARNIEFKIDTETRRAWAIGSNRIYAIVADISGNDEFSVNARAAIEAAKLAAEQSAE